LYFGPTNKPYNTGTQAGLLAWHMAHKYPDRADFVTWRGVVEEERTHTAEYKGRMYTLEGRLDMNWLPPDGVPRVGDHKTTGSMRWAKLERADLFGHTQAPCYLLFACEKYGTDRAASHWVYGSTDRTPPTLRVSAHEITLEESRERTHARMLPVVHEMVAARDAGMTGNRMPKNLTACRKYNRWCPHIARCQPEKGHITDMSAFLKQIADAETAAKAATNPANPNPAAPLFTAPPEQKQRVEGFLQSSTQPATNPAAPLFTAPTPPTAPTAGAAEPPAVNPPEGEGGGKGKGKRATGEKGATKLSEADIDALAERVCDKLAARMMRGVQ
jgi:hypothetical protein